MGTRALIAIILLGLIAAIVGYYVNGWELQSAPLAHITTLSQIENVLPTQCSYPVGSYGTGSAGYMYIYDNEIRVNIPDVEITGFSGSMQAVIGTDGTRLMDPTSAQVATAGGQGPATILNTIITEAPWQCGPWWFPDGSQFNIPNAVSF